MIYYTGAHLARSCSNKVINIFTLVCFLGVEADDGEDDDDDEDDDDEAEEGPDGDAEDDEDDDDEDDEEEDEDEEGNYSQHLLTLEQVLMMFM